MQQVYSIELSNVPQMFHKQANSIIDLLGL